MSDRPAVKRFKPKAPAAMAASQGAAGPSGSQAGLANTSSGASTRTASPAGVAATAGGSSSMQRVNTGSSGGVRSAASTPGPGVGAPAAARPAPGPAGLARPGMPAAGAARTTPGSTPVPIGAAGSGAPPQLARASTFQKFKPKVPTSSAIKAEPRVKTEPGASVPYGSSYATSSVPYASGAPSASRGGGPSRGAPRGRGSTRGRGRGAYESVASGVFATARTRTNYRPSRRGGGITAGLADMEDEGEVYSDEEGGPGGNVIDMGAISTQGESAPTALIRAGRETGKAKAKEDKDRKAKEKAKRKKDKDKGKQRATTVTSTAASATDDIRVKPEPISPEKRDAMLAPEVGLDEDVDMDAGTGTGTGTATPEGDEIEVGDPDQGLDLSESEDEEEEETMQGDFVQAEGMEDPSAKIYMFQFPNLFPRYEDHRARDAVKVEDGPSGSGSGASAGPKLPEAETLNAVSADGTVAPQPATGNANVNGDVKPDIKPDIKPNVNARPAPERKGVPPRGPPEGQVGKLVVMKSGKVKMIMGDDIVMNVAPGVPSTFLQHLVHLDPKAKSLKVIGDINKHFTVQPDIDRLLHQLWLNDGVTPNDIRRQNYNDKAKGFESKRAAAADQDRALDLDELNHEYFEGI